MKMFNTIYMGWLMELMAFMAIVLLGICFVLKMRDWRIRQASTQYINNVLPLVE